MYLDNLRETSYGPRDCNLPYDFYSSVPASDQIQQQPAMQTVIVDHTHNLPRSKRSAVNTFIYYICMILCYFPMFTSL